MLKLANCRKLFDYTLANKGLNVYLCSNNHKQTDLIKNMSSKKVKGSALYLEDGGLIFTPYSQNPQNSIWRKAIMVNNGKLRCTDNIVQIRLTAKLDDNVIGTLMNAFSTLMVKLPEVL